VHPAAFEPTIPVTQRPQTRALDCSTTGIDINSLITFMYYQEKIKNFVSETSGVTWTRHAEGGQRTEKVNSLINVLCTKLRIEKKDRKLLKIFD